MNENHQKLKFTLNLCTKTGQIILDARKSNNFNLAFKKHNKMITSTDKQVDNFLIDNIHHQYPDHQFLTEERYEERKHERLDFNKPTWGIDPIDGTVNFSLGHPRVAISIAFIEAGEVKLRIAHCPFLNEIFYAMKGSDAYMNKERICCNRSLLGC